MRVRSMLLAMRGLVACLAAVSLEAEILSSSSLAQVKVRKYICSSLGGIPTVLAFKADGEQLPVIRWTNMMIDIIDLSGWKRERRCKEIAARLDTFNRQGRLKYFTSGRINGQTLICTALGIGLGCDGLLFTLKPWQNARSFLDRLRKLQRENVPLYETNGRLYINIDELLTTP
jgi:hypothetical protein